MGEAVKTFSTDEHFHSVVLLEDECKGCTHCVRGCPSEAIRVREGKAGIDPERCTDCGECIRICPNDAKEAFADELDGLTGFKYNIAIPAPAIAGQFKSSVPLNKILSGLINLGFDEVYEVALGAEITALTIREYLGRPNRRKPLITSACPAVIRLIQVRFPSLVDYIIPIDTPMDIAAKVAKLSRHRRLKIPMEDIGIFFISPCPAKVTAVKQPVAARDNYVNGAIAMKDIYNRVMMNLEDIEDIPGIARAGSDAIAWGTAGGENDHVGVGQRLAVDGTRNVLRILEKIEDGDLKNFDYVELQACVGG
ncbi:MAG: 4Fe-4S dicluster domain-containing protein [bacterium]|nr:4Fe-4S dicluster domain-containing protein [bacterium]